MVHALELLLNVPLLEIEVEALGRLGKKPRNLARLDDAILLEVRNHEGHQLDQFLPHGEQGGIMER